MIVDFGRVGFAIHGQSLVNFPDSHFLNQNRLFEYDASSMKKR
jgi:hypothetical protein